jgi:drug/metabolite transporter (DMT)-like permease
VLAAMKYILVISTVLCTLASALLLDHAAKLQQNNIFFIFMVIGAAVVLNFTKFFIWGRIYRKYPLATTYPITASFFPLIYIIALGNGQATLEISKIIAIALILSGIYLLSEERQKA